MTNHRVRLHESVHVKESDNNVYPEDVDRSNGAPSPLSQPQRDSDPSQRERLEGLRRRLSQSSDTAVMHFYEDDRVEEESWSDEEREEEHETLTRTVRITRTGGRPRKEEKREAREEREEREYREERGIREYREDSGGRPPRHRKTYEGKVERQHSEEMAVDYSSPDFRQSLATIDAASRDGVRVRQQGDTTIVTEHRDPYSFYWQLDQARREESPPRRRPPPTDYVIDEEEVQETVLSPNSNDSGVAFEPQYSRPREVPHRPLPAGWEKHQDPSGYSYYWHVDSGTIQRDPPPEPAPPPQIIQLPPQQPVIEEHAFKQTTTKRRIENEEDDVIEEVVDGVGAAVGGAAIGKAVRFAVRSLGWTDIDEEDLTAERSSRAVNRTISDLSRDLGDNIAKWGDGRELIMELDENELRLIEPDSMAVVHAEKIQNIRVWGVGRDNGRDFAYVARDRNSRRFLCHVFRCDTPAKTIANTLRDICRRLMSRKPGGALAEGAPERRLVRSSEMSVPIDEPKKVIRCHFIGVTQVPRATGIDVLNDAVDRLVSQVHPDRWILSDVSIAPSTLVITEVMGSPIATCRVRYLSFLGIGRDVKHCAFIMQVSSESFMCYVFHVEPSAASMAKTIEAACKLRYQKLLDAHSRVNGKPECDPSSSVPPPPACSVPSSPSSLSPPSSSSFPANHRLPTSISLPSFSPKLPSIQVLSDSLRDALGLVRSGPALGLVRSGPAQSPP